MTTKSDKRDVLVRLLEALVAGNVGPTESLAELLQDQKEIVGED